MPSHGEWRRHTDQIRKLGEEADMTNITPPVDSSWEPGIELRNPTEQVSNSEPFNSIPSADPPKSTRYPSRNRHLTCLPMDKGYLAELVCILVNL